MTKTNMDLIELLQKHDQGDLLRSIAEAVLQLMMESDVDGLIGAGRHERAEFLLEFLAPASRVPTG